ncbi:2-succinyl-5-enolpyruvyl-6-hydroxy-3-cyclohexene-1-carboxylic-acid synthase [Corynebacterium sp. HS2168-gen11]|uniref:2-succinyl-5-enolpyruvyl-6-hydroxy-3- cyclohexene-1-carboxylic-acid synthase n=1 Tax=Corynebacterium sp. HS2168-gen11 TaxID=2974027 RepID=UPI00216B58DD|nr:2-succinyl-5-enolpyruvyl-6-hydroxy-3-cyclohexene-1-carboxylic-acid synthase [Corynebacterium sp. HS2168-gen11]MCS4535747.1 2-succinyl-5-enolpyruvyl-6-hydroxy-3-cyclohexene-1-carboxylic-acid synthase [Corynebacterium sp. HS2168-gen11]
MTHADTQSPKLAAALARELARHLTDIVICPGSRNSALSLALLARSDIRIHSRIDERSAAFLALGIARVTGRHVGVLTTSGTAVANCLPSCLEAQHSHTPLAIISADRPAELVGTGANQTIEQRGLLRLDTVEITTEACVDKLVDAFTQPVVHINARFAEPLVAGMPQWEASVPKVRVPKFAIDHGSVVVDLTKHTLVIAGDEAWRVDGLEDVPTIAEPTAPAPYHPVHPLAAGIFLREEIARGEFVVHTKPEQIIVVGHPTLHRDVQALIADPAIDVIVLSRTETIYNPAHREITVATRVTVQGVVSKQWLKITDSASQLAAAAVREILEDSSYGFTGLHVAAAIADTIEIGEAFFVGASNPVRDASFVGFPIDAVETFSPRGTAGIDGNISQATGVALAVQAREPDLLRAPRTIALLGDVTFLHEVGGLLAPEVTVRPENMTLVVANDHGGGIFETLEVGDKEYRKGFEQAFGTAHTVDLAAICQAYGHTYHRVESLTELLEVLLETNTGEGVHIIEAVTTRETRREMHADLRAKLAL